MKYRRAPAFSRHSEVADYFIEPNDNTVEKWNRIQRIQALKRPVDLVVSLIIFVLILPLFAILALLVLSTGGPVLYSQTRVGYNGRLFDCYKFRSMKTNADQVLEDVLARDAALRKEWEESRKLRHDPRVTAIGSFLRKTSLDEIPQLLNVIRGDMSMIGPRPVVASEICKYGSAARWYLAVRPGMTGLWQVSGRNDIRYRRRVALDTVYVRRAGVGLDVLILLKTVRVVLFGSGAY